MHLKIKGGLSQKKASVNKKKFYSKRQGLRGTKLALLALGILLGILLLGKSLNLISGLTKPFNPDILTKKQYSIDFKSSVNIAFKTKSVWLLNYDPIEKKVVSLKIPDDTYLELPRGFGSWRVGSVYNLGQEENPQIGSELLKESLAKLLGLPVDGFVTLQNTDSEDLGKLILSWHNNPLAILNFLSQAKTDLTPIETFRLFSSLSRVRSDKIVSLDLEQTDLTKSKLLPDLSRVLGVNIVNLDLYVREKMSDQKISQEGISIAVFNATTHPGLAQDAARIITNLGGNPIIVSNTESYSAKTLILGDKSATYKRLAQIFAPWCLESKCNIDDPRIASSRAQINIILGEDYYRSHYQR